MPIDIVLPTARWLNWASLSWLGDSGLLLPAAAAVAAALALRRSHRRLALRWALAFGCVGSVVLATKIAFMGWGIGSAALDFTGVSGHAALAIAFWPVAGWYVAQGWRPALAAAAIACGIGLAVAIGISRVVLDAHSPSEVIAGLALGSLCSGWVLAHARRMAAPDPRPALLAMASIAALVLALHGKLAPTTEAIELGVVHILGVATPFTRLDLYLAMP